MFINSSIVTDYRKVLEAEQDLVEAKKEGDDVVVDQKFKTILAEFGNLERAMLLVNFACLLITCLKVVVLMRMFTPFASLV